MKTLKKITIVGSVIVVVLAVTFFILLQQPTDTSEKNKGIVFLAVEPIDVESVKINNDTGSYSYEYVEDGYVLDDIPGKIVDMEKFINFMTNASNLSALRQISEDSSDTRYGTNNPIATAEIKLFDGRTETLLVGNQESISGDYYGKIKDKEGIYLFANSVVSPFLMPKTQIVSYYATPQLAITSPLSAIHDITFTGGNLAAPITMYSTTNANEEILLEAMSFGTATHIVKGEGVYQLDQTYGVAVLGSLFGVEAEEVVGYNLTNEEIEEFGFNDPWMTIEYDMINGVNAEIEHCLLKIMPTEENKFFIFREGTDTVYLINREPFIDLQYDKLILRWLLAPLLMDLSSVSIDSAEGSYTFEIDNTDPRNPIIINNGKEQDVDLFRSFYRLITSAAHDGNYLGSREKPTEPPVLRVTYTYADSKKTPDVMELYPGDTRRNNVFVNNVGEFAMKDIFAERVIAGCNNLIAGQTIEENW